MKKILLATLLLSSLSSYAQNIPAVDNSAYLRILYPNAYALKVTVTSPLGVMVKAGEDFATAGNGCNLLFKTVAAADTLIPQGREIIFNNYYLNRLDGINQQVVLVAEYDAEVATLAVDGIADAYRARVKHLEGRCEGLEFQIIK